MPLRLALCFAICLLALPVLAQLPGEPELRKALKAPLIPATGLYVSPESATKLRGVLKANPKLIDQPIYQLRGEKVSTPLVESLTIGNVDAVRVLLELKAKPNLALGDRPIPPLQVALDNNLPGEVRLAQVRLLLAAGANAKVGLHLWAACQNWTDRKSYFAAADALVQAKAGVNSADGTGSSPLQIAIVSDNVAAVEKLLALGAAVDDSIKASARAGYGTPEGDKIIKILKLPAPKAAPGATPAPGL